MFELKIENGVVNGKMIGSAMEITTEVIMGVREMIIDSFTPDNAIAFFKTMQKMCDMFATELLLNFNKTPDESLKTKTKQGTL